MENRFRCKRIEVPFELSLKDWLREKESNLHLRVQSPTCCRLHHPAKTSPIFDFRLPIGVQRKKPIGNRQSKMRVVAVEGIEPTSLDYQSSALAVELHREVV